MALPSLQNNAFRRKDEGDFKRNVESRFPNDPFRGEDGILHKIESASFHSARFQVSLSLPLDPGIE
jgi:hypothetical protein